MRHEAPNAKITACLKVGERKQLNQDFCAQGQIQRGRQGKQKAYKWDIVAGSATETDVALKRGKRSACEDDLQRQRVSHNRLVAFSSCQKSSTGPCPVCIGLVFLL